MLRPACFVSFSLRNFRPFPLAAIHSQAPVRLELVGRLEDKKEESESSAYLPGQPLLHRVFGYRGTVLTSWSAHLYERNSPSPKPKKGNEKTEPTLYYLVLIDKRDASNLNHHLKDSITLLQSDDKEHFDNVFEISGLDYVPHSDVIPYEVVTDEARHDKEIFRVFFDPDSESKFKWKPSQLLQTWLSKKSEALTVTTVHRETTEGIQITAVPFYMGRVTSKTLPDEQWRYWRYMIRIENLRDRKVQLMERFWKVFSIGGCLETVKGNGVVGVQPILDRNNPVFQYSSHTHLKAPWGHMWGSFRFVCESGASIDVKVPPFPLCTPQGKIGLPITNFIVK